MICVLSTYVKKSTEAALEAFLGYPPSRLKVPRIDSDDRCIVAVNVPCIETWTWHGSGRFLELLSN
jgi:hypothetical protein